MRGLVLTYEELLAHKVIKVIPRQYLVISEPPVGIESRINAALRKSFQPLVEAVVLLPAVELAAFLPCGIYRLAQ